MVIYRESNEVRAPVETPRQSYTREMDVARQNGGSARKLVHFLVDFT